MRTVVCFSCAGASPAFASTKHHHVHTANSHLSNQNNKQWNAAPSPDQHDPIPAPIAGRGKATCRKHCCGSQSAPAPTTPRLHRRGVIPHSSLCRVDTPCANRSSRRLPHLHARLSPLPALTEPCAGQVPFTAVCRSTYTCLVDLCLPCGLIFVALAVVFVHSSWRDGIRVQLQASISF